MSNGSPLKHRSYEFSWPPAAPTPAFPSTRCSNSCSAEAPLTYLAAQCLDDLEKHCGDVEMGEGRVATCLLEHKKEVSEGCRKAIDDTGLEVVEE